MKIGSHLASKSSPPHVRYLWTSTDFKLPDIRRLEAQEVLIAKTRRERNKNRMDESEPRINSAVPRRRASAPHVTPTFIPPLSSVLPKVPCTTKQKVRPQKKVPRGIHAPMSDEL